MTIFDLTIAALRRVAECQDRAGDHYDHAGQHSAASRAYATAAWAEAKADRLENAGK